MIVAYWEGWPSGLRRTPGKRVGVNAPPGFESRPSAIYFYSSKLIDFVLLLELPLVSFVLSFVPKYRDVTNGICR